MTGALVCVPMLCVHMACQNMPRCTYQTVQSFKSFTNEQGLLTDHVASVFQV